MGELGLGDAQVLGLSSRNLTVELRETEQRRSHPLLADLRRLTLRVQLHVAHETGATRDLERNHHPVTDLQVSRLRADFFDDPHRFVAEDISFCHEGAESFVQVEIGPANVRRGHLDDGVRRLFDLRIGDGIDADLSFALPRDCAHWEPNLSSVDVWFGCDGGGW